MNPSSDPIPSFEVALDPLIVEINRLREIVGNRHHPHHRRARVALASAVRAIRMVVGPLWESVMSAIGLGPTYIAELDLAWEHIQPQTLTQSQIAVNQALSPGADFDNLSALPLLSKAAQN